MSHNQMGLQPLRYFEEHHFQPIYENNKNILKTNIEWMTDIVKNLFKYLFNQKKILYTIFDFVFCEFILLLKCLYFLFERGFCNHLAYYLKMRHLIYILISIRR